jgi:hypothetical protein
MDEYFQSITQLAKDTSQYNLNVNNMLQDLIQTRARNWEMSKKPGILIKLR